VVGSAFRFAIRYPIHFESIRFPKKRTILHTTFFKHNNINDDVFIGPFCSAYCLILPCRHWKRGHFSLQNAENTRFQRWFFEKFYGAYPSDPHTGEGLRPLPRPYSHRRSGASRLAPDLHSIDGHPNILLARRPCIWHTHFWNCSAAMRSTYGFMPLFDTSVRRQYISLQSLVISISLFCLIESDESIRIYFVAWIRVRPKFGFGFGYGAETDLTHGFGLVSATAKVQ